MLEDSAAVEAICRECGSFELRAAETAEERALIWRGRKSSFAAMGRISPSYYVQDGVVPRTRLPEVLRRIYALGDEYGLRIAIGLPRRRRQPAPARALRRRASRARPSCAEQCATGDPRRLHRRGRLADRRARRRRRQGVLDAEALRLERPRRDAAAARRVRSRRALRTPARCCRRRGSAARCRGRTAHIRWSGPGLPSVSEVSTVEPASVAEAAEVLTGGGRVSIDREGGDVVLSTARLTACSSTSRAT